MTNEDVIRQFYTAFQNKDWKAMQSCYHPKIVFSDPVFPNLKGKEALAMWHMLLAGATDLATEFSEVKATGQEGRGHCEAKYRFSKTGRKVHNKIDAKFTFEEGLIVRHRDQFNLWAWSSMALGPVGTLLGWTPMLQRKIRIMAATNLKAFIEKNPDYQ